MVHCCRQPAKKIYSAHSDAIRIVPLHVPDAVVTPTGEAAAAAPAVAPQLTYRNGPLIAEPQVFTLFWGAAWQSAQAALVIQVNQFFDFILTSPLIDQLAEYNVPAYHRNGRTRSTSASSGLIRGRPVRSNGSVSGS